MAYGYWKLGLHEREAVFQQIYRKNPFQGHYALTCGLGTVIEFLQQWRFADDDLAYLQTLQSQDGHTLFPTAFLDYLKNVRFSCDIDAIPEGTVVFPQEPLIRIKGPLLQGQLLESTLLNIINFQTLIATKAARVVTAAQGDTVIEFGMRRAQGPDGALSASRASFIGGCDATSNVLAGKLYDIPLRGTHAHSWVTVFPDEISAFLAYADVMPHNCVLLVDTYDTIQGVKHAIEVGKKLRLQGSTLQGIRLDSGDMASLSQTARQLLDAAGFTDTQIIASNSLDEYVMTDMKQKNAPITVWGVGTRLVTAYDHPALDGVYKLSALRDDKGQWQYKLKLSEETAKISTPGSYQVRRYFQNDRMLFDVMYDETLGISEKPQATTLTAPFNALTMPAFDACKDLLVPVFRGGKCVYPSESIHDVRKRSLQQVKQFLASNNKTAHMIGLENQLHILKQDLINKAKR